MVLRRAAALLLAAGLGSCLSYDYEYEHEFWLKVDGSGSVSVTGRPELWAAFKGLGDPRNPEATVTPAAALASFKASGLVIRRAVITHRSGRAYLFVLADFKDVNALSRSAAFPDLRIALAREGRRLRLDGDWQPAAPRPEPAPRETDGLMAVRFHLPSKLYEHKNAADGVERGNIVGWRQEVAAGIRGEPLAFGALMDERSILTSTVVLFGGAIVAAAAILSLAVYAVMRRGRRDLARAREGKGPARI